MPLVQCRITNGPDPLPGFALFSTARAPYHAALIAPVVAVTTERGITVTLCHMKPPLHARGEDRRILDDQNWLGWFEELSPRRYQAICEEMERVAAMLGPNSALASRYDLGLHGIEEEDLNDHGEAFKRVHASCASFLEHCYECINVDLVDVGQVPAIPSVESLAEVLRQDPRLVQAMFKFLKVSPQWPCPILLPAYQMRAFQKPLADLPHRPFTTDHPFS